MPVSNPFGLVRYLLSLAIAMSLNIAPWPGFLSDLNPDWILLTLIYWSLATPERVGIFNAWWFGLLTDVLTGRMLGQHALTYSLVIYLCLKLHKRLRQYPMLQQGLFISACLLTSQLINHWFENTSNLLFDLSLWLPVLTGTVCWPFIYSLLRLLRLYRRYR